MIFRIVAYIGLFLNIATIAIHTRIGVPWYTLIGDFGILLFFILYLHINKRLNEG